MYWITAYNTPDGGRTFSLDTDNPKQALKLALEHVERVNCEDKYFFAVERLINELGWYLENKNE